MYKRLKLIGPVFMLASLFAYGQKDFKMALKIRKNVVKITSRFVQSGDEKYGFGFISGEYDDVLFIVTAAHTLVSDINQSSETPEVLLEFFDLWQSFPAKPIFISEDLDLALISVSKPDLFSWQTRCLAKPRLNDEPVRSIGRIGGTDPWHVSSLVEQGKILEIRNDQRIIISIGGIGPGSSGGPILQGGKIIGMLVEDTDSIAEVIGVEVIKNYIISMENGAEYFQLR